MAPCTLLRIVPTARVAGTAAIAHQASPDDQLATGPNKGGVDPADRPACILAGERCPRVGSGMVDATAGGTGSAVAPPAPDDHFFASPDSGHLGARTRRVYLGHWA